MLNRRRPLSYFRGRWFWLYVLAVFASFTTRSLLHLLQHLGERSLDLQSLLDLVARDIGVLAVLEETRTLMVAKELDERGGVRFPVHRKALEILEGGVDAGLSEKHDCVLG